MTVFLTKRRIIIAAAITVAYAGLVPPSSASALQEGFYNRKAEGWFWYDDPVEPAEPPLAIEPPAPIPTPVTQTPRNKPETPAEPPVFSTAWLRKAMPKYLDLAIDEPTVENVRAYMYLQRIMMDKAERFAMSTQRNVMGDPFLDESVRRPLASFAIGNIDEKSGRATTALVEKVARDAGLFFFFRSDCQLCMIQAPLIKNLQDHLGFVVIPVSLDGKNLPDSPWPTFRTDNGQAEALNVQALPATYLASADGEFEVVGQSAYALPELKDRILLAARRKNWISQEDFNETRPIANFTNIAEILDNAGPGKSIEPIGQANATSSGVIPSADLMKYIDSQLELLQ